MMHNLKIALDRVGAFGVTVSFMFAGFNRETSMDQWVAIVKRGDKYESFSYKTGLAHRVGATPRFKKRTLNDAERLALPAKLKSDAYLNLIECLILDYEGGLMMFEDFCSDFGYDSDSDSRKIHAMYMEMQETVRKLRRLFSVEEIVSIQDAIAQDNE